jgi:hypothetical protein
VVVFSTVPMITPAVDLAPSVIYTSSIDVAVNRRQRPNQREPALSSSRPSTLPIVSPHRRFRHLRERMKTANRGWAPAPW